MSDDPFRSEGGGNETGGGEVRPSERRCSTVTDRLDTTFELLADPRRRYLLYYVVTGDSEVVELEAAVDAVCDYEAAGTASSDHSTREDVRIALHHVHLPRLADAGMLEYDHRQGTVRCTRDEQVEEWVALGRSKELE